MIERFVVASVKGGETDILSAVIVMYDLTG